MPEVERTACQSCHSEPEAPAPWPPRHGAGHESLEKVRLTEHDSLLAALHIRDRELVSLVGGGGKTAALQLLARETHAGAGGHGRVVATTTTAMFPAQLEAIGAVVMRRSRSELLTGLNAALAGGGPVSAAREVDADGKAKGLPADWVDEVFAGLADRVFVEADGSRGKSLKAFAAYEPQVPADTTVIVQVAGLDALDAPLDDSHVHRAALLGAAFGWELGTPVTAPLFVDALRAQLRVLRRRWPAARIVTLLGR